MTELREASLLVKANLALRLILEMAMLAAYGTRAQEAYGGSEVAESGI